MELNEPLSATSKALQVRVHTSVSLMFKIEVYQLIDVHIRRKKSFMGSYFKGAHRVKLQLSARNVDNNRSVLLKKAARRFPGQPLRS